MSSTLQAAAVGSSSMAAASGTSSSALRSAWRGLRTVMALAYRADPGLFVQQFAFEASNGVLALFATYAIKLLVDAAHAGNVAGVVMAAGGIAVADLVQRISRQLVGDGSIKHQEKTQLLLDRKLMGLAGGVTGLEHHERADYADELALLRSDRHLLGQMPFAAALNFRVAIQLVGQPLLLASLHPLLALLPLCGIPSLLAATLADRLRRRYQERNTERARTIGHLFDCATRADAGKELRLFGMAAELLGRHRRLSGEATRGQDRVEWQATALGDGGQLCFAVGYVSAVGFILWRAMSGEASAGDVALAVSLGAQVGGVFGDAVGRGTYIQRVLRLARRFLWLADFGQAALERSRGEVRATVPHSLSHGITLEGVSFAYPGMGGETGDVLRNVSLHLPAGKVVALVGENGAGKTTLVKLLGRFHEPSEGRVTVDGMDLRALDLTTWRSAITAAFQDFVRFELRVRETVGIGDLPQLDAEDRVRGALDRAGAETLVQTLPAGLETQLGPTWPGGVDLSGGQWQRLALARAFMRPQPLLIVFDEPTAAIDAQTEHALFERIATAARGGAGRGAVTLLISHRFSTVRMADLIVVLEHGRVKEQGTHEALMRARGTYAELYSLQAAAYR